ncbi:putative DNA methylase [Fervidicoccus fontis Kam940]|uniref:Putative DNA methylase n=1 Tax=Fervidicoccus fontis (strain DSM 19380 / JCM 18336 / VKM B-2539 / Kam940) TaxID=1163730 RepID=H9ZZE3_FERFK|nr:putative DNA methylase [Fervidicoccus fontis Kam940]
MEELEGRKLLDPFAGFGSIPLEGMRFGSNATAVELLPTAYVFLKGDVGISGSEAKQLEIEDIVRSFNDSRQLNNSIEYKLPS